MKTDASRKVTLLIRVAARRLSAGYSSVSATASDAGWIRLLTPYTTLEAWNSVSYTVSDSTTGANQWLEADLLSLTAPQ